MIKITDKKNCSGCHACYSSCPQKCISMQTDNEGFWYPIVDINKCTECGLCEKACPVLKKMTVKNDPRAYACINQNNNIRQQSSSGGVFSVIAERVIANNGLVFGAGFDSKFNVVHSWTDNLESLGAFRGSKYVQSCMGDTLKQSQDFLKQGRQVLFSGTPCQIGGLRSYLGRDYKNLVCLDIICHGVPSPLVWQNYHSKIANNKEVKTINFRDKTYGWKRSSLKFTYNNHDDEHIKDLNSDEYMQGFLKDVYLRPSCYECNFKTLNRQSDITLADFWGIGNVLPSFDDDKGTSLILVNSKKGQEIFCSVTDQLKYEEVDINLAITFNPSAIKSVEKNPKRDEFFRELFDAEDIIRLLTKYTKDRFPKKAYKKIRTFISVVKTKILG